jgi:hypothetical protein
MPDLPDDAKQFINTEFARRLESGDPPFIDVIIETRPGEADAVVDAVERIDGVTISATGIIDNQYIPATVPDPEIANIARIEGVELVHQDQLVGVLRMPLEARDIPFLSAENDPIRSTLSATLYQRFAPEDPYVGTIGISEVEVPRFNFAQLPPGDPFETLLAAADEYAGASTSGEELIPTSEVVDWYLDSGITQGAISDETKLSVIDTGHTPTPPENGFRFPRLESWVPGEPPADMMGHGSWCTNMAVGGSAPGAWGTVEGVAPGSRFAHFKALNTFPGFGKTSWILKSMSRSLEWGADVVSMSLGGAQQGPVDEDPYSRYIRDNCKENAGDEDGAIFVVAAGNSGPQRWTIGSPGVAPKALTVGAWSMIDGAPSVFSSRGPQGGWYAENTDTYQSHVEQFGADEFVKPDVTAPGGGRKNDALAGETDELLFQASTGWYDGLRDGLKDNRSNMKGTSMATPGVAGLVKRLYDAGIIDTAAEVKRVVRDRSVIEEYEDASEAANERRNGKNITVGFGRIYESLFDPGAE